MRTQDDKLPLCPAVDIKAAKQAYSQYQVNLRQSSRATQNQLACRQKVNWHFLSDVARNVSLNTDRLARFETAVFDLQDLKYLRFNKKMLPISSTVDLNSKRSFFGFRRRCRSCIRRRLFLFHPSFIALLPCLLLVFLWFLLPEPYLPKRTTWDPKTRSVLQSSLKKLQREQATVQQSVTSRIQVGALKTAPKRPSLIHDTTNWIQRKLGFDDDDEEEIVATTLAPPRVLLLTAIPETPCRGVNGSHLTLLALKNKQEYARLLGWDFQLLLSPESTMNSMGIAPENRLKQVKQVMDTFHDAKNLILGNPPLNSSRIDEIKADQLDIRHAWLKVPAIQEHMGKGYDWIVWSDMDALFLPEFLTSFQQQSDEEEEEDDQGKGGEERIRGQRFPFERYEGKDLVLWGQWRELQNGDAHMGLNTGIMLIRDTESMRRLMLDVMVAGAGGGKFYEPVSKSFFWGFNILIDFYKYASGFKNNCPTTILPYSIKMVSLRFSNQNQSTTNTCFSKISIR